MRKRVVNSDGRALAIEYTRDLLFSDSHFRGLLLGLPKFGIISEVYGSELSDVLTGEIKSFLESLGCDKVFLWGKGVFYAVCYGSIDNIVLSIQSRFSSTWDIGKVALPLGYNLAIADSVQEGVFLDYYFGHLEFGLRKAETSGKNATQKCSDELREEFEEYQAVHRDVDLALKQGTFLVYYQPIVSCKDEKVVKAEALVRLKSSTGKLVPPNKFLPIIFEKKDMLALDKFVFEEVCSFISRNNIKERIYVNLTPSNLLDSNFISFISSTLKKYNVDKSLIGLEILEHDVITTNDEVVGNLANFKDTGVRIAIDDFGTGYSCLWYLKKLPLSDLKISRELIKDILICEEDKSLVELIVGIARTFGCDTTAEGVETREIADAIIKMGITFIQGFYYARPMSEEDYINKYYR